MAIESFIGFFQALGSSIPEEHTLLFTIIIYTVLISLYSVFIWKFYRFIAERDIIKLNLKRYNKSEHPQLGKIYEILLSTLEYVIILPFLVFFWFVVFSLFFLILSESQNAEQILLITAAIIASTRITAYISQSLSREIAKIFPFTLLFLFLLDPNFFDVNIFFGKVIQIPSLLDHIMIFIVFIFSVELILRMLYSAALFFYSKDN